MENQKRYAAFLTLPAALLVLSACATSAEDVRPTYVSTTQFETWECEQLSGEYRRVRSAVSYLSEEQDDQASGDAALTATAIILFWPAAFFIEGDDQTTYELAEMKGRRDALLDTMITQDCEVP